MSVTQANALTVTWASMSLERVFSAAAIYPLLALLATVAAGPARTELQAVAPTPLDLPVRGAQGLWTREGTPLTLDWAARSDPRLTGDQTVDRALLGAWAAAQTGAPVPPFTFATADEGALVLAAALAVTADWAAPFTDGVLRPASGPWAGRRLASLHRRTADLTPLQAAETAAGPVTLLTVRGTADVDVLLCTAGGAAPPPAVLAAAVERFTSRGTTPRKGPGITAALIDADDPAPELVVKVPRFAAAAAHDLLAAEPLGLRAASSPAAFPGISPDPLRVSAAGVSVAAAFTGPGFRAAPVTRTPAVPMPHAVGGSARRLRITVRFDEPFGYLAVHRPTGLVLMAGWVDAPEDAG